jgi:ATP-dependent Clp protease ATP-binding subunit ClpX
MRCSFCNKSQFEIQRLVAGGLGVICDECVRICVDILDERASGGDATAPAERIGWPGEIYCSLCHAELGDDSVEVENRGLICTACAVAVQHALAQRQKAKR